MGGDLIEETEKKFSDEILRYISDNDMITLALIQEKVKMRNRQEILDKHPYRIYQGNDKKWYTYLPDDEKGRRQRKRNTKKEIEEVVIKYWKDQEENPTVKQLFNEWIETKHSRNIQNQTVDRYKRDYKKYLSTLSNRKIKNINECELDDFLVDMVFANNMTAKSFSNVRILVRGIWNRAKKKKLVDFRINDVLDGLELSKNDFRKPEKTTQVYTDKEREIMVEYLKEHMDTCNLGLLIIFASGLRIGELAALKPGDISDNKIRITKTEICYEARKEKYVYEVRDFPKTEAGIRDVRVQDDFIFFLKKAVQMASGQQWLFQKNGERMKTYQFQCRLRYICKKLNMPVKSPHKIRKTYASCLIDNGVPEDIIISQMGHTDIETTKNHYYYDHYDDTEKDKIFSNIQII